jgi:CRISPR-associated endoribonuclease Cas6
MQLNLEFENTKSTAIPIDYQYYLSSWMYKVISRGDEAYADFLHNKGYLVPNKGQKHFKLFNFSNLIIAQQDRDIDFANNCIYITGKKFKLKARFKVDAAMEHFVSGLFNGESLQIKNGFNKMASFGVQHVAVEQVAVENDSISLKTLSPIVISKKRPDGSEEYLAPEHEDYEAIFFNNLLDKYIASGGNIDPNWHNATQHFSVIPTAPINSKLISITKPNMPPIKVRGFMYSFKLQAPAPILNIGLLGGFGKECAMGFGFGEVVG